MGNLLGGDKPGSGWMCGVGEEKMTDTESLVYWAEDAQLMGYGETDTSGAWIKFQISPDDLEKFRGLKGTVFYATLVKRQDSGEPEIQKGGPLAKWAGILCSDTKFWVWCNTHAALPPVFDEEQARLFITRACDISSRRELDHNPKAARIFREQIMQPFDTWKRGAA